MQLPDAPYLAVRLQGCNPVHLVLTPPYGSAEVLVGDSLIFHWLMVDYVHVACSTDGTYR
jgi:hypothetical protein